jgi:thiol-disulfide isomerase/thioredoxin
MKFALLAAGFFTLTLSAQEPRIPRKASDIGIQIGTEKYLWLSEQSGKTVVVAFILTTCPHCQFTVGLLSKIQKDYADKGVLVMATAIEPMSSLHIPDFVKTFKPQFPIGYNEQSYVQKFLGRADNDPMFMPQLVFVDRNGIIQTQYAGDDPALAKDIQEKSLRDAVEKALKAGAAKKP